MEAHTSVRRASPSDLLGTRRGGRCRWCHPYSCDGEQADPQPGLGSRLVNGEDYSSEPLKRTLDELLWATRNCSLDKLLSGFGTRFSAGVRAFKQGRLCWAAFQRGIHRRERHRRFSNSVLLLDGKEITGSR